MSRMNSLILDDDTNNLVHKLGAYISTFIDQITKLSFTRFTAKHFVHLTFSCRYNKQTCAGYPTSDIIDKYILGDYLFYLKSTLQL